MLNRLALAALACLIAAPASAQLIQRKDLSYAMAKTIAENALADCKARGYAVSVVVVDRGGDTIVALRAERRGSRNVVALYLDSQAVLRLRAPYDGRLLAHDPQFERRVFLLRDLWETHRRWNIR